MTLKPGSQLGPYTIEGPLGVGGMGEVYRARDTRLDRTVALKILRGSELSRRDRLERFKREARAISRLNHPHICALHDIGEQDGDAFLVMEYVDGETLAERLVGRPLAIEEVLRFGEQIAAALTAAHREGVVHLDLHCREPTVHRGQQTDGRARDAGLSRSERLRPYRTRIGIAGGSPRTVGEP